MKENFIHVCFIIDSSGSMHTSVDDVVGGFNTTIEQQKKELVGECKVSLYTFDSKVKQIYLGKDVNEINGIDYQASGMTALFDGVGIAIDEVGKWLASMKEDDRPSKNLFIIMTDGEENCSHEYTAARVSEMIQHQEEKYNWSFVYMGADVTTLKDVKSLGIKNFGMSSKSDIGETYTLLSNSVSAYRNALDINTANATMDCLFEACCDMTAKYEADNKIKLN
jgi:uncharacterized protein YegL